MFAQWLSWPVWLTTLCMIATGAGIMAGAIVRTRQILVILQPQNLQIGWWIQFTLMISFLGGYCLALYLVFKELLLWIPILMGLVFFLGAFFVLFSVNLYYHTLQQLLKIQNEYRQAKDWAEASLTQLNQAKMHSLERTVAGLAHEINNPVTFIHSNLRFVEQYSQALLEGLQIYQTYTPKLPSAMTRQVENLDFPFIQTDLPRILKSIQAGTERIQSIISILRNFSRLDEADYKFAHIQEGIDSALLVLNDRLQPQSNHPAIAVNIQQSHLPAIFCNPRALNQVFLNLIENAIDALRSSNQPAPLIDIRTEIFHSDWVRISISDNGSGINPSIQPRIFDPFFTTKPIGKGSGLGLSLSYQVIVKHHRGNLTCYSQPNTGTTFHIELPI
ncbi:sensor histidine kinase [Alkalinema pantanalense CENA528]|uniref:sensor histidine kinase n=1 Tax=Alkalinema pantanalense TaxID=1620705 RepID=UPI003D6EB927